MSHASYPVYPSRGHSRGPGYAHPPSESEFSEDRDLSFEAEDMSPTETGTPSWTESAPTSARGSVPGGPRHLLSPRAASPDLAPIPDLGESELGSDYLDANTTPSSGGSRPGSRAAGDAYAGGAHGSFAQPNQSDAVRFQQPPPGTYTPSHEYAVATGLLQPHRPALAHRASSRDADRGHPFSVEHMSTDAELRRGDAHPADHQQPFFDPTWDDFLHEKPLELPFFDHVVQRYGDFGPVQKARLAVRQFLSFLLTFGVLSAVLVASIVHAMNPWAKRPPRSRADREYETRITGERGSGRVQYYCEFWGYTCDEYEIVTEGGWILKAHRIGDPRRKGGPGYPVICQHGILCNSSHFVVCEERSLAFWLVDHGYDVWLTNIRSNYDAGHTHFGRDDPRFWAFGLKELALDLKDVVEFICEATGFARLAYIGHSQGSGSMYAALSPGLCPELGDRLSVFVALGPSVFAGPVLRRFPFSLMRRFRSRQWWSLVFGVKVYIPAIGLFHRVLPTWLFGHIAAALFAFMFNFNMALTPKRQLPKLFRTAAVSTSSELLYWYMAAWAHRGCIFDPRLEQPWFPPSFPPHSMFYGSVDMLVIGKPLADRLLTYERNVDVLHCVELDGYEHLDFLFAHDAWRVVYPGILDSIEATIDDDDYPAEDGESVEDEYRQHEKNTETVGTIKIAPDEYSYGTRDVSAEPYVDRAIDDGYQPEGGYHPDYAYHPDRAYSGNSAYPSDAGYRDDEHEGHVSHEFEYPYVY